MDSNKENTPEFDTTLAISQLEEAGLVVTTNKEGVEETQFTEKGQAWMNSGDDECDQDDLP